MIGLSALSGCGGDDTRRDVYKSREDCLADWGNKPEDCTPATQARHAGTGFWYGPPYVHRSGGSGSAWTSRSGTSSRSAGGSSVSRGGFGSSARSSGG